MPSLDASVDIIREARSIIQIRTNDVFHGTIQTLPQQVGDRSACAKIASLFCGAQKHMDLLRRNYGKSGYTKRAHIATHVVKQTSTRRLEPEKSNVQKSLGAVLRVSLMHTRTASGPRMISRIFDKVKEIIAD